MNTGFVFSLRNEARIPDYSFLIGSRLFRSSSSLKETHYLEDSIFLDSESAFSQAEVGFAPVYIGAIVLTSLYAKSRRVRRVRFLPSNAGGLRVM